MSPRTPAVPPVDLRQVLYFVTVAAELNFSRAAERLHISAPALSQQVKALERRLGVQLLVRDTRHVQLTAAGARFAEAGQALLDAGAGAVRDARREAGLVDGRLVIACLHEADAALEPLLTRFHARYPAIEVSVTSMRHAEVISALRDRAADLAFTWSFLQQGGQDHGLQWLPVASVEVLAAVDAESPLAAGSTVPRGAALRGTPVVMFERAYSPRTFDYALEELYGAGYDDPPVQEVSVTVRAQEAMARMVAVSGGLAPLSRPVAEMVRGSLTVRPFDPPWFVRGCIVSRRDRNSPAVLAFLAGMDEEGRDSEA